MLIWIVGYLLFCISGWAAMIEMARMPVWKRNYQGEITVVPGGDITLCDCLGLAVVSLIPILNLFFNLFWFQIAWDYWRKGRPLPKCRVVFKGRTAR